MDDQGTASEIYAFGPFRADVGERMLTRGGQPIAIRAKVFDTLVAFLRRPGRLIGRDELIAVVWPDTVVDEGSLSKSVSALRKALRDDGRTRFIETVPGRGYRFVGQVQPVRDAAGDDHDALARARNLLAAGAWPDAYRSFEAAAAAGPIPAADRAAMAAAARFGGVHDEVVPLLEQAADGFRAEGDAIGATRTALDLATVLLDRRQVALAASHVRQAARQLPAQAAPGTPEAVELARAARLQGRLLWADADWSSALERSAEAAAAAKRSGDRDTEAMALMDCAHALVAMDRYAEAGAALDEAGAILAAGQVSPYSAGMTHCGIIFAWRACGRWDRVAEWVDAAIRWAARTGIGYFSGLCRVHRGETISLRGELERAEADLREGTAELVRADSGLAGVALRELGAVHLRRGDLDAAEAAFARALEFGTDPQPGLALLRAARGQPGPARRELERFLADDGGGTRNLLDRENRVAALAAQASLAAAADEVATARRALEEIEAIARATGSAAHRSAADGAAGEVALAEGRIADAVAALRSAWNGWAAVAAPYEAATARIRLADALLAEGDATRARMELEGAAATLDRIGATLELRRARALLGTLDERDAPAAEPFVVHAEVAEAEDLRRLIGDAAWHDLIAWLERTLAECWREHGGRALRVAGGTFAAAFGDLATCAECIATSRRTLDMHRTRHGFAPRLRVGIASSAENAAAAASRAPAGAALIVTDEDPLDGLPGIAALRHAGLAVRRASPAEFGEPRHGG